MEEKEKKKTTKMRKERKNVRVCVNYCTQKQIKREKGRRDQKLNEKERFKNR